MPDIIIPVLNNELLPVESMIIKVLASLLIGIIIAVMYMFCGKYNKNFVITLSILPAIVQIIVMVVSGSLGVGIAMAGTFNLVRFRSVPGNARDLLNIFFAMSLGLLTGIGFLTYAFIFLVIIGVANIALTKSNFGKCKKDIRILKITILENLDYENLFDDLFIKYTANVEIDRVKTSNMGSMYEITYIAQLKSESATKEFIDELRCRNGNLTITLSREILSNEL